MNLAIHLDRAGTASLQDQLFEQLRQLILVGALKPSSRVMATRCLADQAGVSRTTVALAYERLISEGYLDTRPAVGTFVCAAPPEPAPAKPRFDAPTVREASFALDRATAVESTPRYALDFSPHRADTSHVLPEKIWLQAIRSVLDRGIGALSEPRPAAGAPILRRAIVDHLARARGIVASPEQVIVVAGRRQACALVAHVLCHRGDRVILESPGDDAVQSIFALRGADTVGVPVDEFGLMPESLPPGAASLAYVTPARQTPIGGKLPAGRRLDLLAWAQDSGAYLLEDDSDTEVRFHGTTPQTLWAQDRRGGVFYIGSFAGALGPGLGLGFIVAPERFVEPILAIKSMAEEGGAWLEQMVLAELLACGGYEHHLRRVRKVYLERRDCLIGALRSHFGNVRLVGAEIGPSLTWVLPDDFPPARAICEAGRAVGVNLHALINESSMAPVDCRFHDKALILGYAALAPDQLRRGVAYLAQSLAS